MSMFTIIKELIYIGNKKNNKMKKFKLIKWVMQGDTCQITTSTCIFPVECIFLQRETYIYKP